MARERLFAAIVVALLTGVTLMSPVSATAGQAHQVASSPLAATFGVGIERCTFVDPTRGVLNYATKPNRVLAKSRTLVTEIRYPTQLISGGPVEAPGAAPVAQTGGYPTIVFAHGYDSTPDVYAALLDAWVEQGFVVVAPFFPDENALEVAAQGTNTEADLLNEPADLAFVTNAAIHASSNAASTCPILSGLVNASAIALAGHSDGAVAVALLAYDRGLDDLGGTYSSLRTGINYRAVIVMSGAIDTSQSNATEASRPNLLVIQSLADQCNPFRNDEQLYNTIHQPNKWFLELRSAHHLPPFDGIDVRAFRVVATTTVHFLQLSLDSAAPTTTLASVAAQDPSTALLYSGPLSTPIANVPNVPEHCGPN